VKHIAIFSLLFLTICKSAISQNELPPVLLRNISGSEVNFKQLISSYKDTTVVISFWATWCIPCITELDNISEVYQEKQAIKPFKFIGVSIDDSRTAKRVKPFIKGKGWIFDVLLDLNGELKRALNITDVPHVIMIKNGSIIYRHTGYIAGEEENLYEEIKKS